MMLILRGENSAKRQKTSEHGTYVFGESSFGQVNKSKPGPSTLGNQEQLDDFDFWMDSYATDDDELPTEKVSQELVEEMSQTVDEAKLRKVVDEIADRPEVTLPPQKRLGIALGPRYEVGESLFAPTARPPRGFRADYGFVATLDREIMRDLERDVRYGITDTWNEMLIDMLGALAIDKTEDRRAHARTTLLMEREARMSREAWGRSMDASDLARSEVMSLRTTVLGQQAVITEL
ncbi:hypothetical protein Tco_0886561 [Tanacetum coccineum]